MTPEELNELRNLRKDLSCLPTKLDIKELLELRDQKAKNEQARERNEQAMERHKLFNKVTGYGMMGLYGIVAGFILTNCAYHYKP
jgi:hypothetical protein